VIAVHSFVVSSTGERINETQIFSLPADSYRDLRFLDFLLSKKDDQTETTEDFNEVLYNESKRLRTGTKGIGLPGLLNAKSKGNNLHT